MAMRRLGLHVLQLKAYTPRTTDSTHGLRCGPNRLLDQSKPTRANQVWVSDSTYLQLDIGNRVVPGRAYLCAFRDIGTKHVVGGHDAGRISHHGLAAGFFRAAAHSELNRPL